MSNNKYKCSFGLNNRCYLNFENWISLERQTGQATRHLAGSFWQTIVKACSSRWSDLDSFSSPPFFEFTKSSRIAHTEQHSYTLHPNISSSRDEKYFCTSFHDFSVNFQHFIPIISTKASQILQMTENYRIKFVWRIIRVSTAPASDSLPLGSLRNPFTTCDNSTCTDRLTIQAILPVTIHSHLLGRSEKLHSQYTCIYAVRVSRISRVQKHCQQAVENHHRMEHCVYNFALIRELLILVTSVGFASIRQERRIWQN